MTMSWLGSARLGLNRTSGRIAMISEHASPLACLGGVDSGGQNVYVSQVSRGLANLGYEVDIYTRRDNPYLPEQVTLSPGMRLIHVDAGPSSRIPKERLLDFMPEFSQHMLAFIHRHRLRYMLAHANFFMSGMVAMTLRRVLGLPYVITFHALGKVRRIQQGAADTFPLARETIEQSIVASADAIIAECPQDAEDLDQLYHAPRRSVHLVPCGVDLSEFYPTDPFAARQKLGLPGYERIILQLGRIVPRKGIDNVIEALAHLVQHQRVRARLLVVGGDSPVADATRTPEIGRLEKLAQSLGVAKLVTFCGAQPRARLREYYSAADVFVSTPWYEPFGITPLEAMACGIPVIGANVGGIRHSVADGISGMLVEPRDPQQLANRLELMLNDAALRQRMAQAGLARVRERFTWSGVALALNAVYRHAVPALKEIERRRQLRVSPWRLPEAEVA